MGKRSTDAFAKTEDQHNSAITRLKILRSGHADMLRATAQIYTTNDDNSAEQLTQQMPDR